MSDTAEAKNTDRELWREREGDYYSPSLHVTEGGGIGFDVGGNVVVKPIREWHRLAASEMAWKIMAKQEARYANLPLSEREAALQKALEATTADQVKAEDEVEQLRAALFAQEDADRANEGRVGYTQWQQLEDKAKDLRRTALNLRDGKP